MQKEGLTRHVGLSEVSVEQIDTAHSCFPAASVQSLYNLANRRSEAVVDYCTASRIGFIPWFPLAASDLVAPNSVLGGIAARLGASPGQVALAWLLKRSPAILPIPGTSSVDYLWQNVGAAELELAESEFSALEALRSVGADC